MRLAYALLMIGVAAMAGAAEPISFNKHIRPILADRCFKCHGPDSATREAGLRLDREDHAKARLEESGNIAIVAGNPKASEILARMTDPDEMMPPPESNLKVSKQEIALIRQWIAEGAKWERHWAFIPPEKSGLPAVKDKSWPLGAMDYFILHRLESEGLRPSRPADRPRWLRRVTFDLTGLPPTLAELDAFLADKSKHAWSRVVDRLLKSPAYGERMAVEWLDVARYGDTDGLFEDHARSIYPWRDWVVDAFNTNLSYKEFITWQLAGDLLPKATVAQRVATGFIRNNPTSNEGGIIEEDYRVKYLVDRVNTTATAMLGVTLECAQCHDHKFDPMTQREYYQFAGFFNSVVGRGNTKGAAAPTVRSFTPRQTVRIRAIEQELASVDATLESTPAELIADFEKWLKELDQPVRWQALTLAKDSAWRSQEGWLVATHDEKPTNPKPDAVPAMQGRYVRIALPKGRAGFLTLSEVQVFSDGNNIAPAGRATQSSDYHSAVTKAANAIDGNHDGSFASCSCTQSGKDGWWEVDLGASYPIDSVAVWNRTDCCPERLDNVSIQVLTEKRETAAERVLTKAAPRNALPESATAPDNYTHGVTFTLSLEPGPISALQLESKSPARIEVLGARLSTAGNSEKPVPIKLTGDRKLKLTGKPVIVGLDSAVKVAAGQRLKLSLRFDALDGIRIAVTGNQTPLVRKALPHGRAERLKHFRDRWAGFRDPRRRQDSLTKEKKQIKAGGAATMIAADTPKPRTNYFLMRGEYDKRGDVVATVAPASIMAYADDLPKNRVGLARWMTHPKNPLTARVAVNRYWQMVFGTGIVKTSEDFGTQGDRPSHQQLLDHLAVDFVKSGWDVKALLRKMVLSATYRQRGASHANIIRRDPANRLLSHGPRRRLQAEFLRDHVLAVSGLLVDQRGGPGVHPYQPAELFGANAIGAANARFKQGRGDDLYRRSLYTYWKRQIPAANMRILGARGRTACRTRREPTNTPLQALVMLNDPQFVEAARVLAERSMRHGGDTSSERLAYAFRLVSSRRGSSKEMAILQAEFEDRLREFKTSAERRTKYLAGGGARKPPQDLEQAELAAYAATCSLIMNLDESMSK